MIATAGAGMSLAISLAISYSAVVIAGYALHATVTFEKRYRWRGFIRYAAAMLVNLPASFILLFVLKHFLKLPMFLAAPLATGVLFCWNFLTSRWAILHVGPDDLTRHEAA